MWRWNIILQFNFKNEKENLKSLFFICLFDDDITTTIKTCYFQPSWTKNTIWWIVKHWKLNFVFRCCLLFLHIKIFLHHGTKNDDDISFFSLKEPSFSFLVSLVFVIYVCQRQMMYCPIYFLYWSQKIVYRMRIWKLKNFVDLENIKVLDIFWSIFFIFPFNPVFFATFL